MPREGTVAAGTEAFGRRVMVRRAFDVKSMPGQNWEVCVGASGPFGLGSVVILCLFSSKLQMVPG